MHVMMMVVLTMNMLMSAHRNYTSSPGHLTTGMLKLNRSVMNLKPAPQNLLHTPQNTIAARRRHILNQHMTTKRM